MSMRSGAARLLSGPASRRLFSNASKDTGKEAMKGTPTVKPGSGASPADPGAAARTAKVVPGATGANVPPGPASARTPVGTPASTTGAASTGPATGAPAAASRPLTAPGPMPSGTTLGSSSVGSSSSSTAGSSGANASSGSSGRRVIVPLLVLAAPVGAYLLYDQYLNGLFGPGPVIGGGGKVFDGKFFGGIGGSGSKGTGGGPGAGGGSGGAAAGVHGEQEAGETHGDEGFSMRTLEPGQQLEEEQAAPSSETGDSKAAGTSQHEAAGTAAGGQDYSAAADEFPGTSAPVVDATPLLSFMNEALAGRSDAGATVPQGEGQPHEQVVEQAAADQSVSAVQDAQKATAAATPTSDDRRAAHGSQAQAGRADAARAAGSAHSAARAGAGAGAHAPAGGLPSPRATGFKQDLTPGGLVARALEDGYGAQDDWGSYGAQLRQATSDAAVFREALDQVRATYQARLDDMSATAEEAVNSLRETREQAEALSERYKQLMKEQARLAQEVTKAEVRRAEERVLAATADHAVKERKERLKALDDVRMQLNALNEAFGHRSDQARTSTDTHRVSLGILALERALETGRPFVRHVEVLRKKCGDDALLQAALSALPEDAARRGLPTERQLEQGFANVKQAAKELSYFPPGSGGMVAHLVAKLAAKLKVDESPSVTDSPQGQGPGASMAQAEAALAAGKLQEAADALEAATAGSEARAAAAGWVEAARRRAVAEQTLDLLRAHAAATAASLA